MLFCVLDILYMMAGSATVIFAHLNLWGRQSHWCDQLTFFLIRAKETQITLLLHLSVVHH